MWFEIHWCAWYNRPALYVGTEDGYVIGKMYANWTTARLAALLHGYRICK